MSVVHAVYENGVFKPREPVALPESCEVEFEPRLVGNAVSVTPRFLSNPNLSPEQARRLIDEMAAMGSGRSLPADWSRADLYDDHD